MTLILSNRRKRELSLLEIGDGDGSDGGIQIAAIIMVTAKKRWALVWKFGLIFARADQHSHSLILIYSPL